jgi:hypothetical protein
MLSLMLSSIFEDPPEFLRYDASEIMSSFDSRTSSGMSSSGMDA